MSRHLMARMRSAMPAPTPDGVTFHYHATDDTIHPDRLGWGPNRMRAPAVEARLNGEYVGHLSWEGETRDGRRKPGIVDYVWVDPYQRRQGIANKMFDLARQHDPRVRHSPTYEQTDLGRAWVRQERRR